MNIKSNTTLSSAAGSHETVSSTTVSSTTLSSTMDSSIKMPSKVVSANAGLWQGSLIWFLGALFYFYDNLLQISPSAMKPELMLALANQAEEFGSLSAYFLYAYGLMQIPAGLLLDRFGPRRIITVACILCALGSLIFGFSTVLWEARLARVFIGIGASFAFVSCLKIVSIWFSQKRFSFMTGLTAFIGFLGSILGLSTVSHLVLKFGWRESMQWGGFIGFALAILLWGIVRDSRNSHVKLDNILENSLDSKSATASKSETGCAITGCIKEVFQGLIEVLKNKQTWIAAVYAGLMFVPTLTFAGLWGIPFLVEGHGFDRDTAGFLVSFIFIGWLFGAPFWGYVSDKLGRKNGIMRFGGFMTVIICCLLLYFSHIPAYALKILLWSLGFFSSVLILAFAVVQESNQARFAGTAIGFTNALNTFFGALFQHLVGKMLDITTAPLYASNGERIFSFLDYQKVLSIIPVCVFVALCVLFLLKEMPNLHKTTVTQ